MTEKGTGTYIERVESYREEIPDGFADQYEELLSEGCAPRFAAGTLRYIAGRTGHQPPVTQQEVAVQYDMTEVTVRKWASEIRDSVDLEGNFLSSAKTRNTVPEIIREIAIARGWEEASWKPNSGEFRTSSDSAHITNQGLADLTGEETAVEQMLALADEYDLQLGEDMVLNLTVNKTGYQKILAGVDDE